MQRCRDAEVFLQQQQEQSATVVLVAASGSLLAAISVMDRVKPEAAAVLAALKIMNIAVFMATGGLIAAMMPLLCWQVFLLLPVWHNEGLKMPRQMLCQQCCLAGDSTRTASVIAASVGIANVIAEVLPAGKAEKVGGPGLSRVCQLAVFTSAEVAMRQI